MKKLSFIIIIAILAGVTILVFGRSPKEKHIEYVELGESWAKSYLAKWEKGELGSVASYFNFVPDENAAISTAVNAWNPIFGKQTGPVFAYLVDGYWVVTGSLPERAVGGTPKAIISQKTGEIVHVCGYR